MRSLLLRSPFRWLRSPALARRGFSVIELVMALVVLGLMATIAIVKLAPSKESTARAAMKNDLRNYALAEELYSDGHTAYADTTAMRTTNGFHYTPKVYPDSQELYGASEWYLRVGHQQTNTRCELRVKGPALSNTPKIYCYTQLPGGVTPLGLDFTVDTVAPGGGGGGAARMSSSLSVAARTAPAALAAMAPSPIADGDAGSYGWKNTLYFAAHVTLQPGEEITGLTWDLGDGTHLDGATVNRRYVASGVKTVVLSVSTSKNRSAEITKSLVMINHKPVAVLDIAEDTSGTGTLAGLRQAPSALASANAAIRVQTARKIRASAARSYDPDGAITRTVFDFGTFAPMDTTTTVTKEYIGSGTYLLRLMVYDDENQSSDPADASVVVTPDTSTVHACFTFDAAQAKTDRAVPFDASCSTTTKGSLQAYIWDFGDFTGGSGQTVSKRFRGTGTYSVRLSVINSLAKMDDTTRTVTVISPDDVPRANLTAFWDACVGPVTGQAVTETVGGFTGQRGSTAGADHNDPTWFATAPIVGRTAPLAMWAVVPDDSTYVLGGYNGRMRYITVPTFTAPAKSRTVIVLAAASARARFTGAMVQFAASSGRELAVSLNAAGNLQIETFNGVVGILPAIAWPYDEALHTVAVTQTSDSVIVYLDGTRRGAALAGNGLRAITQAAIFGAPAFAGASSTSFLGSVGAVLFYADTSATAAMSPTAIATAHASLVARRCSGGAIPATLDVKPDTLVLQTGTTGQLRAELRDASANILLDRTVGWAIHGAAAVASISADGVVTGSSAGQVIAYAESEGLKDSAVVIVKAQAMLADAANYWTTCRGYGGQALVDIAGGANGQLGSTAAVDAQDPWWRLSGTSGSGVREEFPVLRTSSTATDQSILIPKGALSTAPSAHTFAFLVRSGGYSGQAPLRSRLLTAGAFTVSLSASASEVLHLQNYGALKSDPGSTLNTLDASFTGTPPTGAMQTVIVTLGGDDSARVYVDGTKIGTQRFPLVNLDGFTLFNPGTANSAIVDFGGLVHWTRALSGAEVAQASTALKTLQCPLPPASPNRVVVSPNPTTVKVGGTRRLSVIGLSVTNDTLQVQRPLWETTDATLATVDTTGLVTGVAVGDVYIRATSDWASDSALVTVATTTLADGATAHWSACSSFGMQRVTDLTGNGNTAQLGSTAGVDANDPVPVAPLNSPALWTNPTPSNKYLTATGVNGFGTAATYMVAFKAPSGSSANTTLLTSSQLSLYIQGGGVVGMSPLYNNFSSPPFPTDGALHTLGVTLKTFTNQDTVIVYLDGVAKQAQVLNVTGLIPTNPGTVRLLDPTTGMPGGLASAIIYPRRLSAAEMATTSAQLLAERCVVGTPDSLLVSPRTASVAIANTTTLTASFFQAGVPLAVPATWTSRTPGIATVTSSGVVTGAFAGTTYIVASFNNLRDSALVTVTRPALPTGLIARWDPCTSFGSQTLRDLSGNGNNGTLGRDSTVEASYDPAWVPATGTRPPLLRGNVSGTVEVRIPKLTGATSSETIVAYVSGYTTPNGTNVSAGQGDYFLGDAGSKGITPAISHASSPSKLGVYLANRGFVANQGAMPTDGGPHIVAWVSDNAAGTVKSYIDGVLTGTISGWSGALATRTMPFRLFQPNGPGWEYINDIGPVLMYNKALTSGEVATMSTLALNTPCAVIPPTKMASLTPNPAILYVGHTQALTLTVRDSAGASISPTGAWRYASANPAMARVDSTTGVVTGVANGTTSVTATNDTLSASTVVTVRTVGIKTITITPPSASVYLNRDTTFTAVITDSLNQVRPDLTVAWSGGQASNGTLVGTVAPLGLTTPFHALAVGTATIRASSGAVGATATVTVLPGKLDTLRIFPKTATIARGSTLDLTALASAEMGSPAALAFTWGQTPGTKGSLSGIVGQNHRQIFTSTDTGVVKVAVSYGASTDTAVVTIVAAGPSAEFTWTPQSPSVADAPIQLDARQSLAGAGVTNITRYEWSMNGWMFATGVNPTIPDPLVQDTPVELRVTNALGAQATVTHTIPVRGVTAGHVLANFTFTPALPLRGQSVQFDASTSLAGSGTTISAYAWSTPEGALAATVNPTKSFQYVGGAEVVLTLTAANGSTDVARKIVPVSPPATPSAPPVAVLTCPATVTLPAVGFVCDASASSDPDAQPLRFTWFSGVGTAMTSLGVSANQLVGLPTLMQRSGTFDVKVLVRDVDGQEAWATARVTVIDPANGAPVALLRVTPVDNLPGATITISGAASSDPDGDNLVFGFLVPTPSNPLTPFSGTRIGGVDAGVTFTVPAPTIPGVYEVRMRVSDLPNAPRRAADSPEVRAYFSVTTAGGTPPTLPPGWAPGDPVPAPGAPYYPPKTDPYDPFKSGGPTATTVYGGGAGGVHRTGCTNGGWGGYWGNGTAATQVDISVQWDCARPPDYPTNGSTGHDWRCGIYCPDPGAAYGGMGGGGMGGGGVGSGGGSGYNGPFGPYTLVANAPDRGRTGDAVSVCGYLDGGNLMIGGQPTAVRGSGTYSVNWGDGATSVATGTSYCLNHTYGSNGTYGISVSAMAADGRGVVGPTGGDFSGAGGTHTIVMSAYASFATDITQSTLLYRGWQSEQCLQFQCFGWGDVRDPGAPVVVAQTTTTVPGYGNAPGNGVCPWNVFPTAFTTTGATRDIGYGKIAYQGYFYVTAFTCVPHAVP